jgi:hypothetical protein
MDLIADFNCRLGSLIELAKLAPVAAELDQMHDRLANILWNINRCLNYIIGGQIPSGTGPPKSNTEMPAGLNLKTLLTKSVNELRTFIETLER